MTRPEGSVLAPDDRQDLHNQEEPIRSGAAELMRLKVGFEVLFS